MPSIKDYPNYKIGQRVVVHTPIARLENFNKQYPVGSVLTIKSGSAGLWKVEENDYIFGLRSSVFMPYEEWIFNQSLKKILE